MDCLWAWPAGDIITALAGCMLDNIRFYFSWSEAFLCLNHPQVSKSQQPSHHSVNYLSSTAAMRFHGLLDPPTAFVQRIIMLKKHLNIKLPRVKPALATYIPHYTESVLVRSHIFRESNRRPHRDGDVQHRLPV